MTTGLTAASFNNLQLDAGILLKDFNYSTATTAAALKTAISSAMTAGNCLGATRGGGTFTATPSSHSVEADGRRYDFVGGTRVDSYEIKLKTTLIEVTPENFMLALGSADKTVSGTKTTVTLRTDLKDSDYIENLCWIGDTSKGLMLICLKNALNTAGVSFTFEDKGEGTLPLEFSAYQGNVDDYDKAPVEIVWFGNASQT